MNDERGILKYFQSRTFLAFSLGIIFGMVCWDLALEGQKPLDLEALGSIYHFYRVLGSETKPSPILFFLLLASLYSLMFLVVFSFRHRLIRNYLALALFVFMLVIELFCAVPAEMIVVQLGPPESASLVDLALMREKIEISNNIHLAMLVLLLMPMILCREKNMKQVKS